MSPSIPEGIRLYAVGDVHGRADLLKDLQQRIAADANRETRNIEIYLGDYIDRGANSRETIELLLTPSIIGAQRICLRGNHEQTFLNFAEDPQVLGAWQNYGGLETLLSYGIDLKPLAQTDGFEKIRQSFISQVPVQHLEFMRQMPTNYAFGDYYFVHAGVRPGVPLDRQKEDDLMWIRDEFLESRKYHGKVIVHGHTPVDSPEIWPNRVNIDTGAYISNRLTCLVLEGENKRTI